MGIRSALLRHLLETVQHHLPGGSGMLGLLSTTAVVLSQPYRSAAICRPQLVAHSVVVLWPILLAGSLLVMVGGLVIGIEPVVIGGMLTLYCIARFALEYHRRPSGYEVLPPLAHEAGVRGTEG